jgi:predicted dehydrogenase
MGDFMATQMTFAIAGLGGRGMYAYGKRIFQHPDEMLITAVADNAPGRLQKARDAFNLKDDQCFNSAEELFAREKMADIAVIATQDKQHYHHAMAALKKGYHLLLEKPISPVLRECLEIRDEALRRGLTVTVCHVLRYSPFFRSVKELIDDGAIGKVFSVDLVENVGYWHQAHSFVRGNWRNTAESSPMILAKSCHDMDILHYLAGVPCQRLSSYGALSWFKKENAPTGSAPYCLDAKECRPSCPFDAEKLYVERCAKILSKGGKAGWPFNVVIPDPTSQTLKEALKTSPYGRCVYHCDNDVVDHQVVAMEFEGGITAAFTMTGFTYDLTRRLQVMGSLGEITGDLDKGILFLKKYGEAEKRVAMPPESRDGHGGGDALMLEALKEAVTKGGNGGLTGIAGSVHSHVMALAAEHSRLNNGIAVDLEDYERKFI